MSQNTFAAGRVPCGRSFPLPSPRFPVKKEEFPVKKTLSLLLVCLLALSVVAMAESQYPVTWSQNLNGNDYDFSVDAAPAKAVSIL